MSPVKKKLLALTLVELVVAMAITVLLLGGTISFFTRTASLNELESQGKRVAAFVERSRNLASSPDAAEAESYAVRLANAGQAIVIARKLKGSTDYEISEERLVLPDSFEIEVADFPNVEFSVPSGRYSGAQAEIKVKKKNSDSSALAVISINNPGGVNVRLED